MTKKSLFGKFNPFIDESVHVMFALIVSIIGVVSGLSMSSAIIILFSGLMIDIDHLFNREVAKIARIKDYKGTTSYHQGGYVIKILHGLDISLLIALIVFISGGSLIFSVFLFLTLSAHHLWDFVIYPHSWKELFLILRIINKFQPGKRKKFTGIIFDNNTLKY